ncbi:unnamed protein product, partial [Polarella glacialis]
YPRMAADEAKAPDMDALKAMMAGMGGAGGPGGDAGEDGEEGEEGGEGAAPDMSELMSMMGGGGKGGGKGGDGPGGGMDMAKMMEMLGGMGGGGGGMGGMGGGMGGMEGMMGGKGGGKGGGGAEKDDSEKEAADGKYHWLQKGEELQIRFPSETPITKKDVSVKFKRASVVVTVSGVVLLEGDLGGTVEVDECTWCLGPGGSDLQVMLTKQSEADWRSLMK